jgi:hypothetical protein
MTSALFALSWTAYSAFTIVSLYESRCGGCNTGRKKASPAFALWPQILEEILEQRNIASDSRYADRIARMATIPILGLWEALDDSFESFKAVR